MPVTSTGMAGFQFTVLDFLIYSKIPQTPPDAKLKFTLSLLDSEALLPSASLTPSLYPIFGFSPEP